MYEQIYYLYDTELFHIYPVGDSEVDGGFPVVKHDVKIRAFVCDSLKKYPEFQYCNSWYLTVRIDADGLSDDPTLEPDVRYDA